MFEKLSVERSRNALRASFSTAPRALSTIFFASSAFVLMTLSSFPGYSLQFIGAGIENIIPAVTALASNSIRTSLFNFSLTVLYSGLIGVAVTNLGIQLRSRSFSRGTAASMGPGFIAAGCAGCGAGLVGLIGFTGALASLPFNGISVRLAGIALLLFFILKAGDPEICEIN